MYSLNTAFDSGFVLKRYIYLYLSRTKNQLAFKNMRFYTVYRRLYFILCKKRLPGFNTTIYVYYFLVLTVFLPSPLLPFSSSHFCLPFFQDEWLTCQRNWLYLESIFLAPDIKRQLPAESKMFVKVDKSWKEIMSKVNKMPNALKAATQPGR